MKTMNSSKSLLRVLPVLACLATVTLNSGCFLVAVGAAGAAGAGTVAYVRGELDASINRSFDNVDQATNRALVQLQFAKISEGKSAVDAEITARTGQDKKIAHQTRSNHGQPHPGAGPHLGLWRRNDLSHDPRQDQCEPLTGFMAGLFLRRASCVTHRTAPRAMRCHRDR